MVKLLILVALLMLAVVPAFASWVDDYKRSDGIWVSGHNRDTSNDGYTYNNYGSQNGNTSRVRRGASSSMVNLG